MTVSKGRKKTRSRDDAARAVPPPRSLLARAGGASLVLAENRPVTALCIALFVTLSFLYFPSWGGGDYDMWWHFALGKHYLAQQTMKVDHSIFSWTPADPRWLYNTWLGSTVLYLFYAAAGGVGLWLFQWGILAGIFLLLLSFVRSTQGKMDITAISLLFMVVVAAGHALLFPKPELFTLLWFIALVALFFSIKLGRRSARAFFLYPLLFLFWVNLHGGFIVGLGIVAILSVTEWLNYLFVRRTALPARGLIQLGCSAVLACLACLLNPYGFSYLWETVVVNLNFPLLQQITGNKSPFVSELIAYLPVWPYLVQPDRLNWWTAGWVMIILFVLFVAVSAAAFRKRRFLDLSLLFLNPFLFYYGMHNVRACVFFPPVAFFSLYYTMAKADLLPAARQATLAFLVLFLLMGSTVLIKLTETSSFNFFGAKLEETVPVEEVELIKKHNLPPPLFNDYLSGGYMIWAMYPDYKVFIDPRGKPYETTGLWDSYSRFMENPTKERIRDLVARYPFRVALINLVYAETIIEILANAGGEWRLLSLGRNAAILVHASVVPGLPAELLSPVNRDPAKFRDLSSPEALSRLFLLYVNRSAADASAIRDIYRRNVSNFYRYKERQLAAMAEIITERSAMERAVR